MRTHISTISKTFLALCIFAAVASCNSNPTTTETTLKDSTSTENKQFTLKPTMPVPAWAPSIKPEMQVVIEKLISLGGKPIETLDAKEARMQPTPTDAVMAVMRDNNITAAAAQCDTMGKEIPVTGGTTHVRIYTPKQGKAPYPVIVYYHGGGWVIADINVYNGGAQALCEQVGAVVVSVEYPKGPEQKFPAAHNVSFDAYQWVLKNFATLNGDSTKLAVAGESAGGNLAANMSIMARDKKIQMPLYQVLVYPIANNDINSESYVKFAAAKPLSKPMMEWFIKNEFTSPTQAADPRVSLVKANLAGLPKTLIIGAEIDPLQTEGKLLSDKLSAAGVVTDYQLYIGVTHEFFGMAPIIPQAKEAQALAAAKLKAAFGL
ncbi:MAG: alpha/beta hydrolase [Ferruginibacter sp.]|nr:alpha/beta hydrolase [Ferruginibacter sp.]